MGFVATDISLRGARDTALKMALDDKLVFFWSKEVFINVGERLVNGNIWE
jgi:hypothetical protein